MSARLTPKTVLHRPSIERLHELFELDETGELRWARGRARAGDVAGYAHRYNRTSYRLIRIKGKQYPGHAIVWAMTHARWPAPGMDIAHHPDPNGLNNHPDNLWEVPHSINAREKRHHIGRSSLFQGRELGTSGAQVARAT
jgi:hypothetical protein